MKQFIEKLVARLWNRLASRRAPLARTAGLLLGNRVVDEVVTPSKATIPHSRRATHIAILGRTGTGKSSLIRWFCEQDVKAGRGFFVFDIHGELTSAVLSHCDRRTTDGQGS
jgi:DNA helicase HerA-like ATPase